MKCAYVDFVMVEVNNEALNWACGHVKFCMEVHHTYTYILCMKHCLCHNNYKHSYSMSNVISDKFNILIHVYTCPIDTQIGITKLLKFLCVLGLSL